MRRAPEVEFWVENDQLIGVVLSANLCAEHEWGITDMKNAFGVNASLLGINARTITKCPNDLQLVSKGKVSYLIFTRFFGEFEAPYDLKFNKYQTKDCLGAWDERNFGLSTNNKETAKHLEELFNAFQSLDVALYIGKPPAPAFSSGGLCIVIKSRLPKKNTEEMLQVDLDKQALTAAANKTGVFDKVSRSKYYALTPKWEDKDKTKVIFWLNPSDQINNNYGWFSAEHLLQWLEGKGPIPKKR